MTLRLNSFLLLLSLCIFFIVGLMLLLSTFTQPVIKLKEFQSSTSTSPRAGAQPNSFSSTQKGSEVAGVLSQNELESWSWRGSGCSELYSKPNSELNLRVGSLPNGPSLYYFCSCSIINDMYTHGLTSEEHWNSRS